MLMRVKNKICKVQLKNNNGYFLLPMGPEDVPCGCEPSASDNTHFPKTCAVRQVNNNCLYHWLITNRPYTKH